MIPHRFGRLLDAVLLLAPSLAFGQATLQQPCTDRTRGCTVQSVPASIDALYANDVYLQGLIGTRFGQLGGAAFLNVGTMAGTVADGGALAAEISRAQAAEALKAPLASPAFTGTPTVPTATPGTSNTQAASTAFVAAAITAGGGGGSSYAVLYTSQTLTAGQQLQARQNIGAVASGDSHVLGNGSTATTQAAGDNTTKVATDAFVTGAVSSYASTVSATYLTQSGAASTYAPLASPALTGAPTAPTQPAADNSTKVATTAYADRAVAGIPIPLGQVRLSYSSASALLVKPCQGNQITVNGAFQTVPAGGVTCSNAGLTTATLYYAYLYVAGSTLACEMVTTAHATGSNGVEIKSGDATRTLVGMAYTGAGSPGTFVDSATQRFVASWFNRQDRVLNSGTSATYTTASTSPVELSTAQRLTFVSWADEAPVFNVMGGSRVSGIPDSTNVGIVLDGTNYGGTAYNTFDTANYFKNTSFSAAPLVSEGLHYATPVANVSNGNTATVVIQASGRVRS